MSESQDLGQCAHDGDLAAAARLAGQDFDPIDKRADGFDNLRACCLVLQRLLESPDLFTIELRQIGVDNDFHIVLLGRQISIDVSLASLQAPQLIAHRARVTVAPGDEVEAAFDAALDILALFYEAALRCVPFFPEASQFALELSRELVDEPLVAEENIPQPV